MPDQVLVTTALAFVIGMLIAFFAHGYWWERKERRYAQLRQETADWLESSDRGDFVAVRRTEWRWVVDPWLPKPWIGTRWEAQQEDTYG